MNKVSILKNKKILIISPHPDDESICCGGLIMKAKAEKAKVYVLFLSVGNSRQFITGSTDPNTRFIESAKASKFGNFKYSFAFKGDAFMRLDTIPQKEIVEKIEDTSEKFKPNIVIIPFRQSFDQDHRAAATACITTFRPLPPNVRHQPSIILEMEEPYLWGMQGSALPNFFIDISNYFEKKIKLLKTHATQLRQDPFPRSPDNLRRLAGMRGCEIGVKYAEGYTLLRGHYL